MNTLAENCHVTPEFEHVSWLSCRDAATHCRHDPIHAGLSHTLFAQSHNPLAQYAQQPPSDFQIFIEYPLALGFQVLRVLQYLLRAFFVQVPLEVILKPVHGHFGHFKFLCGLDIFVW